MGLPKITYQDKSNSKEVVDRTKQSTAEDWNEVKGVVNAAVEEVETFTNKLETSEVIYSVNSEAEMTAKWNSEDTAGRTPIDGKEQILRTDLNQFFKWNSALSVKAEFSRNNIEVATEFDKTSIDLIGMKATAEFIQDSKSNEITEALKYNNIPVENRGIIEIDKLNTYSSISHDSSTHWQREGFWSKAIAVNNKVVDKLELNLFTINPFLGDLVVKFFVNGVLKFNKTIPNNEIGDTEVTKYKQSIDFGKSIIIKKDDTIVVGYAATVNNSKLQLVYKTQAVDPLLDFGNVEHLMVANYATIVNATAIPTGFSSANSWIIPFQLKSYQVYDKTNHQKFLQLEGIDNLKVEKTDNILNPTTSTADKYIDGAGNLQNGPGYNTTDYTEWGTSLVDGVEVDNTGIILGKNGVESAGIFAAAQFNIDGFLISGSHTGVSYNQSKLAKYPGAHSYRLTYASQNQINYCTNAELVDYKIKPFIEYGFAIKQTPEGIPVFFNPDLSEKTKIDLPELQTPKVIFTTYNNIEGEETDKSLNARHSSFPIYIDSFLTGITEELDVDFKKEGREFKHIFPEEITIPVKKDTLNLTIGDSEKYDDKSFTIDKITTKETEAANCNIKFLLIADSVGDGSLSSVGLKNYTFETINGVKVYNQPALYTSVIKEEFEKAKIENGNTGFDFLAIGRGSSYNWKINYKGVEKQVRVNEEADGGWQSATHLYWSRNWTSPTSQGFFDLLGLGDGTGTDYGTTGDGELVRTTPEGKFSPKDTPAFLAYLNSQLGTSAVNYTEAVAILDALEANPTNPFYHKATAVSENVAYSITEYINRYKTLDSDGVTRLVVGTTAGSKVTDVNEFDVCVPNTIMFAHSHNDGNVGWFAENVRKFTNQVKAEYLANGWGTVNILLSVTRHTGTFYPSRYKMFEKEGISLWNNQELTGYNNYKKVLTEFWVDSANQDAERIFILPTLNIQPPAWSTPFRYVASPAYEITNQEEDQLLVIDGSGATYHPNSIYSRILGKQVFSCLIYTETL